MGDYAKENGHTLYTVIWYSSTTEKWAETQTLEHFVDEYKPTYILLCLGSNELFVNDLDVRNEYIKTIVRKLSRYPFVWIGPADWNSDTGIIDLIASNAARAFLRQPEPQTSAWFRPLSSHLKLQQRGWTKWLHT